MTATGARGGLEATADGRLFVRTEDALRTGADLLTDARSAAAEPVSPRASADAEAA